MHARQVKYFLRNSEPVFAGSGNHSFSNFMYVPWTLCSQYIAILLVIPVLGACALCAPVAYAAPQEILTTELSRPDSWRE